MVDDFTLRGLREHFSYVSMELELLEQQGWKVELDSLVKGENTTLWGKRDAPHCTPPEDAPLPADCPVSRQVKIPIEVRIDLELPTPRAR